MQSLLRFIVFVGMIALTIALIYLNRRLDLVKTGTAEPTAGETASGLTLEAIDRESSALIARVMPSVVSISARPMDPAADQMQRIREMLGLGSRSTQSTSELGSGVIVSAQGHIITNLHVVRRAGEVTVYLNDGRMMPARLLGADPMVDLAVLQIDAEGLQPLPIGDSDRVRVGQLAFAIGNPLGLQETVTLGIISGIGRRAVTELSAEFFQTDAAINPGNSGGPLINARGEMIGVSNSVALESQGISFALPSNIARRVYEDVVERREISRPWFGAITWPLTPDVASRLGLAVSHGSLVVSVVPDSPADKSGLAQGDVIEAINGKPARNAPEIRSRLAELRIGETAELLIVRDSTKLTVPIEVEQQRF